MNQIRWVESEDARNRIVSLIRNSPPILVEVRFPNAATSPDWYLCEEESDLDEIMDRLGVGCEIHASSVWDLKNEKGDICIRK